MILNVLTSSHLISKSGVVILLFASNTWKNILQVVDEVEREVIFVEEVKKSRILCDEIVIADTQIQDTG
jgi:hypothetical protein